MGAIKKVLSNAEQSLTTAEKNTARANIGAAAASDVETLAKLYQSCSSGLTALQTTVSHKQNQLTAGANITIAGNVISASNVVTVETGNIASPRDTPYELFEFDGLKFTFLAATTAGTLRVSSTDIATFNGCVENTASSTLVTPATTYFVDKSLSSTVALHTYSQYELASNVQSITKIKMWYAKGGASKSVELDVLKTGQAVLRFCIVGG